MPEVLLLPLLGIRKPIKPFVIVEEHSLPDAIRNPSAFLSQSQNNAYAIHTSITGIIQPNLEKIRFLPLVDALKEGEKKYLSLGKASRPDLAEMSEDPEIARAAVLNILSVWDETRRNGLTSAYHPFALAQIITTVATDITTEERKKAVAVCLAHAVIEEGVLNVFNTKREKQSLPLVNFTPEISEYEVLQEAKDTLNEFFPDSRLGDTTLLMMEPVVPAGVEYPERDAYFAELLKHSRNPAIINAEIADSMGDLIDVSYLVNSGKPSEEIQQTLLYKFAKCLFTVRYIARDEYWNLVPGVSRNLVDAFEAIFEVLVDINLPGKRKEVKDKANQFGKFIQRSNATIHHDLNAYLEAVGMPLRI